MAGEVYRRKKRLGDMLLQEGVITQEQLEQALEAKRTSDKRLGEILVEMNFTTEANITRALTRQLGVEMVNPTQTPISDEILGLVPAAVLRKYMVIPFAYAPNNPNTRRVAMVDPLDMNALDDLQMITHLEIEPYIASASDVMVCIDRHFGNADSLAAAEA